MVSIVCLPGGRLVFSCSHGHAKQILRKAGLGLKKITLDFTDDEEEVTAKIVSDKLDEDGEPKGFPQLKEVGGFEMLYCAANSPDLCLLKCSRAAKVLKKIFLVKARFI